MNIEDTNLQSEAVSEIKQTEVIEDNTFEKEKEQIEKEIIESMQKEHLKDKKEEIADTFNLKKTKQELIDNFIELQKTQGEILYSEGVLKKMTKASIIKTVGEYTNRALNPLPPPLPVSENGEQPPQPGQQQPPQPTQEQLTGDSFNMIALAMYNMNLCLFSTLESGSIAIKHKTNDIAILEHLTEKYEKRKEAFLVVFKSIYREHKAELDKYLSPLTQYAILTSQVVADTVFCNVNKKKENTPTI